MQIWVKDAEEVECFPPIDKLWIQVVDLKTELTWLLKVLARKTGNYWCGEYDTDLLIY